VWRADDGQAQRHSRHFRISAGHAGSDISTGATNQNQGQYAYSLSGVNAQQVYDVAQKLMARMRQYPGFATVSSDLFRSHAESGNQYPARSGAHVRRFGNAILNLLRNAYSQNYLYLIKKPEDQYQVILEVQDSERAQTDNLSLLYIRSDDGKNLVPLNALVTGKPRWARKT
jgi:multidrug efflux pump subunit AcrB